MEDDNDNDDDNSQEHLQREEQVLADAVLAMLNNIMNLSTDAIPSGFVYTVETLTPYRMGSGVLMTTAAAGIAGFSMWSENQYPTGGISRLSWIPSHRALLDYLVRHLLVA